MQEHDLLQRIATLLKKELGPAIEAEYPKTQAFMASVVLQKLAGQLAHAERDRELGNKDLTALIAELKTYPEYLSDTALRSATDAVADAADDAALCTLIDTLYAQRAALGEERFGCWMGRVRQTLRAAIDRRMEYAA